LAAARAGFGSGLPGAFVVPRLAGRALAATDFAGALAGTRGFTAGLASLAVGLVAVGLTFFRGDGSPLVCLVCLAMQFCSVLSTSGGPRANGNSAPGQGK
jgi:hypothetical protein